MRMNAIKSGFQPRKQEYGRGCKFCEEQTTEIRQYCHSHCVKCFPAMRRQSTLLCSWCQNLRITHYFTCFKTKKLEKLENLELSLGEMNQLNERRSHCAFCRIVSDAIFDLGRVNNASVAGFLGDSIVRLQPSGLLYSALWGNMRRFISFWRSFDIWLRTGESTVHNIESSREDELDAVLSRYSLTKYIEWQQIRDWVMTSAFAGPGNKHLVRWPRGMKVIDVNECCVVDAPVDTFYATLSYVWGGIQIQQVASGRHDMDLLPQTIRDAIIACQRMTIPYLWVDQLCINQENDEEMRQLDQMHLIYQRSQCTLVALSGDDSNYGLPGVTSPRIWDYTIIDIGDMIVTYSAPLLSTLLRNSKWYTRGWTFQEMIVSSNLLFFTDYGTYYWNCSFTESDEVKSEIVHDHKAAHKEKSVGTLIPKVTDFTLLLYEYTQRSLTFDSDILRAFAAILQADHGDATYFGFPLSQMDLAIGWGHNMNRNCAYRQREGFPSWSWTSHAGPIWHHDMYTPAFVGLAHWYTPSVGSCKPRKGQGWKYDSESTKEAHMALLALIWKEGCIEASYPIKLDLNETTFQLLAQRWPTYAAFWSDAFGSHNPHDYITQEDKEIASCTPGRILARCQTAHFVADPKDRIFGDMFSIRSADGESVGKVDIPKYNISVIHGELEEFVLISTSVCGYYDSRSSIDDLLYFDDDGNVCPPSKFNRKAAIYFTVMLIKRCLETGVARRLGRGRIYVKRWVQASPKFKTVILE